MNTPTVEDRRARILQRVRYAAFIFTVLVWASHAKIHARPVDDCEDITDCSNGFVCVDGTCQNCSNAPEQCSEIGRVCDGWECVFGDCDPYDISDRDCMPQVCDPGLLICEDCPDNPGDCPPASWCDYGTGHCDEIPK